MNRRSFLGSTLVVATAPIAAHGRVGDAAAPAPAPAAALPPPAFVLDEMSIQELQNGLRDGQFTSESLTRLYLERIDAIDRRGPSLRAVIELNPDALDTAASLDRERRDRGPRGPLHGIPVLLKDNLDTHDRMTTTAGSLALEGSVPPTDSEVARRLREAGAVLLGKTNLSEWANFRGHRSTSGWSARGGQTRNPYALDRNPSGSSSGSAVAVAANLCAVAVGTETDGSIISPSSYNGIVGIKPTVGLISRSGIIPISHTQDTAGPMARSVRDAAVLLGVLAAPDPADPATTVAAARRHADYTPFLTPDALRGARIGVARQYADIHRRVRPLFDSLLDAMRREGAILVDLPAFPAEGERNAAEYKVLLHEFKAGLNAYFAALGPGAPIRTVRDLIAFNERNRDRELPWFGQERLIEAEACGPLTDPAYESALATCRRLAREEGIDALVQRHQLDAILAPSTGPAHLTDWLQGDTGSADSTSPAAVAGYPSITVPAGDIAGLPVGVSFFGPAWSEPRLLALAYGFEALVRARRAPGFLPTVRFQEA